MPSSFSSSALLHLEVKDGHYRGRGGVALTERRPLAAPPSEQPEIGADTRKGKELGKQLNRLIELQQRSKRLPDIAFGPPALDYHDERRLWDLLRVNGKQLITQPEGLWDGEALPTREQIAASREQVAEEETKVARAAHVSRLRQHEQRCKTVKSGNHCYKTLKPRGPPKAAILYP